MGTDSLDALIAAWLDASQRSEREFDLPGMHEVKFKAISGILTVGYSAI